MKLIVLLLMIGFCGFSQTTNLTVVEETREIEIGVYSLKTISVDNKSELNVLIYPNPVSSVLNIEINEEITGNFVCNVYDEKAALLLSKKITSTSDIIDFSNLPSQIYFVEIASENKRITKKIIKK